MTEMVKRQDFSRWIGVAVLVVCAAAAATADTTAFLYGNQEQVYLDCGVYNTEVIWYHNGSEILTVDRAGSTRYQTVRRPKLEITYPTHLAGGLYECKDTSGRKLKEYSGVKVHGMLVPDNCTTGGPFTTTHCIDANEVLVVGLPPEQWQRYTIFLSYHHTPIGHYPQETPDYPINWIVVADDYDDYRGCSNERNVPCIIASCKQQSGCITNGYIAHGAGLSVRGDFGQEVEVDLTKLAPGDTNGIVEVQYRVNLPYRKDAEGKKNLVTVKKFRFNFQDFIQNFNVWSMNCTSDPCNVTVNESDSVTVCNEMGLSSGEGPMPVHSTEWVLSGAASEEEMMWQCDGGQMCCQQEGCSNRSSVSGEWGMRRCFSLANVSMADNGRSLSFQVQSIQSREVATVSYTLHVTPDTTRVTPAVWEGIDFLLIIVGASVGGGLLVLFLANIFIVVCCCSRKRRRCKRNKTVRMHPAPPVPPRPPWPVPPRPDGSHYEAIYIDAIADVVPPQVYGANQPVNHNQLQVNERDERSQSLQEGLPSHTGLRMLSVSPLTERASSTPALHSAPDAGVDSLSRSVGYSNTTLCLTASQPLREVNALPPPSRSSSLAVEIPASELG